MFRGKSISTIYHSLLINGTEKQKMLFGGTFWLWLLYIFQWHHLTNLEDSKISSKKASFIKYDVVFYTKEKNVSLIINFSVKSLCTQIIACFF